MVHKSFRFSSTKYGSMPARFFTFAFFTLFGGRCMSVAHYVSHPPKMPLSFTRFLSIHSEVKGQGPKKFKQRVIRATPQHLTRRAERFQVSNKYTISERGSEATNASGSRCHASSFRERLRSLRKCINLFAYASSQEGA